MPDRRGPSDPVQGPESAAARAWRCTKPPSKPGVREHLFAETSGNSSFNSLQALYNGTLLRGLTILTAYNYAKSIDDTSAFLGTKADKNFPQNSSDYRAERAASSFDVATGRVPQWCIHCLGVICGAFRRVGSSVPTRGSRSRRF